MSDDTYYITTHEAALAVVATAMKKSRLRLDTLMMTSILGGVLFSVGGMMHIQVQAGLQGVFVNNPGVIELLQGSVYSIGLFYVVMMGTDLFNSNVLFFTVGLLRGAVSILDLIISWFTSFFFNLLGNLFVAYVICFLSKSTTNADWRALSIQLVEKKLSFSFVENMLKGIPSNFLVCMAIYLQLMVKPIHVKFMMMFTPVFVFVSMGFNHVVADMFVIPIGLLNGANHSIGEYIWRSMIPSAVGNIIGGCAFAITIPWYLHLKVVEMDKKKLNLPEYEERDEQPEQGMDSRVVRVASERSTMYSSPTLEDASLSNDVDEKSRFPVMPQLEQPLPYSPLLHINSHVSVNSIRSSPALSRTYTRGIPLRPVNTINSAERIRSPKGVFPVLGMGAPYKRERRLTDAYLQNDEDPQSESTDEDDDDDNDNYDNNNDDNDDTAGGVSTFSPEIPNRYDPDEDKVSGKLTRVLTRRRTNNTKDIETQPKKPVVTPRTASSSSKPNIFKSNFRMGSSSSANNDYYNISKRASLAGLTKNAVRMSDDIAGIYQHGIDPDHYKSVDAAVMDAANIRNSSSRQKPAQRNSTESSRLNTEVNHDLDGAGLKEESGTDPLDQSKEKKSN